MIGARSASDEESSARDVAGEDEAGLGGNRLIGGPGGAGLRRDDRESMAVKACGGDAQDVSKLDGVLLHLIGNRDGCNRLRGR